MKLLAIFFIVFTGSVASAQNKDILKTRKDFFSQPYFKNGKAVLSFKAIYCDLHEDAPLYAETGFLKHKTLLNTRIYSGSAVTFKLRGDTVQYSAPYVSKSLLVNKLKIGTPVCLTIVVFKNYTGFETKHFFVITGISQITKP